MYQSKLVACIKTSGKILREHGNVVFLPFGAEYSILLKNLNTVRADVRITIDGEDIFNGNSLIVNANDSIELERYIKDLSKGNRFKFIERNESVEQHRGVGAEDGLIRIEYQFEKPRTFLTETEPWRSERWFRSPDIAHASPTKGMTSGDFYYGDLVNTATSSSVVNQNTMVSSGDIAYASMDCSVYDSVAVTDVGITVPGSISNQEFTTVGPLNLDPATHSIVLHIRGDVGEKKVKKPITIKHKPKCQTCGRTNKATAKFCANCGTSLEVI